jgi:hypothetical protein
MPLTGDGYVEWPRGMAMAEISNRMPLPVFRTVGQAFKLTFQNLPYLARISWAWVLITAPVLYGYHYLEAIQGWDKPETAGFAATILNGIAGELLILLPFSSIAVAWHRKLLSGEDWPAKLYLRLDTHTWRYLAAAALIWLLTYLPCVLLLGAIDTSPAKSGDSSIGWSGLVLLCAMCAFCAGFLVATRIWLALPGQALGFSSATLGSSWQATKSSFWRLFWGSFLAALPLVVLAVISVFTPHNLATAEAPRIIVAAHDHALSMCSNALVYTYLGMPVLSFLSLAYQHLMASTAT